MVATCWIWPCSPRVRTKGQVRRPAAPIRFTGGLSRIRLWWWVVADPTPITSCWMDQPIPIRRLTLRPSPDAVEEFKVQTGSYSAEFGDAGGAQVNIVTRSGGNQIHGEAYEFVRSSSFDARTFTDPSTIPHLAQNNFGGSVGGPIQRNKTFFFLNYEEFTLSNGLSQIDTVPTAAERAGDFSETGETIYD